MAEPVKLFLCGDVMLGRGVDQALPHPCAPDLHEPAMDSALDYLGLAEQAHGPLSLPLDFASVWGVMRDELTIAAPDARIINLETSITRSDDYEPKGINYRMSPENAACLAAAGIDCCVLANNHVLDWGTAGLRDTLATLDRLQIKTAGAGRDMAQARAPAMLQLGGKCRLLLFAYAAASSGVPRRWRATNDRPGVNLLPDLSVATADAIADHVTAERRPDDIVVVSLHWGPNWGYNIEAEHRQFAHALIDRGNISVLHGHSSHHAKAIEVYRNRLILYGCGDFLNDYEGISGFEAFRGDLALMYLATIDPDSADLAGLTIVPLQIRRFQLIHAAPADVDWVCRKLDGECARFGAHVGLRPDRRLDLSWPRPKGALPQSRT
ncbi:CapA family protein [Bradyrhizobium sp. WD16]|uniref:CapA family protein n=1 Tax=Bradyrhizobium sp. WD16 TaxID=1521768 RepID=UPI0020A5875D|nr:CapA family protein [Bradyrhizobium sp. WD16]UTD28742.1 poly-gamma-glutamate biosynthesis protein [Bradyrhizobium sp. WD16]